MKKYIIPTIDCLQSQFETPLCVGVSDTEHPEDPILAPRHEDEFELAQPKNINFWSTHEDLKK